MAINVRKSDPESDAASSDSSGMDAIELLKTDHAEVADMFAEYEDGNISGEAKQELAEQICAALTVHAQIEEEIFYPAARDAGGEETEDLLDEAEVEHQSLKELIAHVEGDADSDDLLDARVKVLSEYVKHHVKEEEGELFPKIQKSGMDLQEIGAQLALRKEELTEDVHATV